VGKVISLIGNKIVVGYNEDRTVVYIKIRVEYDDGAVGWIYRDEPNLEMAG